MDEFCARLSEDEASELKRRRYLKISLADAKNAEERKEMERLYPAIAGDNDIYTVRSTKSDSIQQKIHDLFAKAGYTEEELAADNKENSVATEAGNSYRFKIPIVYQLEDDDLLAYIPGKLNTRQNGPSPRSRCCRFSVPPVRRRKATSLFRTAPARSFA